MLSFYPLLEKFVINSLFKWEIVSDRIEIEHLLKKRQEYIPLYGKLLPLCIYFIVFKPLSFILSYSMSHIV